MNKINKRTFFGVLAALAISPFTITAEAISRIKRAYISIRYNKVDVQYGITNGYVEIWDKETGKYTCLDFKNGEIIYKDEIEYLKINNNTKPIIGQSPKFNYEDTCFAHIPLKQKKV